MDEDTWDCDFDAFVKYVQAAGFYARDPERRRKFVAQFRREIALASLYLNDLSITGGSNEVCADPPEKCDFCEKPVSSFGFFVDGQTADSSWANVCPHCYAGKGVGIGWGIGQLYRERKTALGSVLPVDIQPRWKLIRERPMALLARKATKLGLKPAEGES